MKLMKLYECEVFYTVKDVRNKPAKENTRLTSLKYTCLRILKNPSNFHTQDYVKRSKGT